ncbi:hypothetical protein U14_05412 [Candidatus Moduliflexus flocculans]|uniref:Glycosyltransferase RgtA/B/C/D-like domain-containing protein n=1 Tax=Candidatus Moduliflexus flocculans TaxID=1499966 RepID=A0A081BRV3_9BACT|nr:hypothetical protein U14_05412 [Candidatus Moduliflexus flocculans]
MPLRHIDTQKSAVIGLLLFSLFLNAYGLWWGIPSLDGWAVDEIIPARTLKGIEQGFSHGWEDAYPPLHYYLLTIAYLPARLVHAFHPLSTDAQYTAFFVLGRMLSVVMGLGVVFLTYQCGREIFDDLAALIAGGLTACIATVVYYAKIANVDVPYLFWVVWSLLFYLRILKAHRLRDYLAFVLTATCAICTKDQAYAFYVLTPLPILWSRYLFEKRQRESVSFVRIAFNREHLAALGVAAITFALAQNLLFNWEGFVAHIKFITGPAQIYVKYPRTLAGHLSMAWHSLDHLRFSFGWPAFLLCIAGIGVALLQKKKNYLLLALLIPAISYDLFFLNVILHDFDRYFLGICVIFTLFGGKFAADILCLRSRWHVASMTLFGGIGLHSAWYAFSIDLLMVNDSRYYVERWIKKHLSPQASFVLADQPLFLPRYWEWNCEQCVYTSRMMSLKELAQRNPDYVAINTDLQTTMNRRFYNQLRQESSSYAQILDYRSPTKYLLIDRDTFYKNGERVIVSNLDKINPRIEIFQRKPFQ